MNLKLAARRAGPVLIALVLAGTGASSPRAAEETDASFLSPADIQLTPEEAAEREGRRACKAQLCAAFRNPPNGQDVACEVTKSLRKEQLDKLVSKANVSWPWGRVVCKTNLKADRAALSNALVADRQAVRFPLHQLACEVDREGNEPARISAEMAPEVIFEKGKAVKATLNWGEVEGPTVIKGAMWTATATDNTVNALGAMIVDDLNDFVTAKCDEVKADWQGQ